MSEKQKNPNEKITLDVLSNIDEEILDRNLNKRFALWSAKYTRKKPKWIPILATAASFVIVLSATLMIWKYGFGDKPVVPPTPDDTTDSTPITPPDEKQIPVYEGMTIESAETVGALLELTDAPILFLDNDHNNGIGHAYGNGSVKGDKHNPNRDDEIDQDQPFGEDNLILDAAKDSLSIVGAETDMYYAKPNEDIYFVIHINNPDAFEILSFTINGTKYSSYMFEEGSDLETLILKYNVGNVEGIVEYTIDAIKYIDGTEIKDVRMEGDRTVKAGIYSDKMQPKLAMTNETVSYFGASFTVSISDASNLIGGSEGKLYAVLYDGETIVEKKELSVADDQAVSFENLAPAKLYEYAIIGVFDSFDGNKVSAHTLMSKAFYTESVVSFDEINVTDNKITYALKWGENVSDKTLKTLVLTQGENKTELDVNATEIALLSDTEYTLTATYEANGKTETIEISFRTIARVKPTVELTLGTVSETKIEFSVSETDESEIGAITKIELLQGETVKATAANTDVRFFDGLLTNNAYTVRLTYEYDMNDGAGVQTVIQTVNATTAALDTPTVELTLGTVSETKLEFSITETDESEIGQLVKIELLQGETVKAVAENTDVRFFDGLLTNNNYTVRLTYEYDLNDGAGVQTVIKTVHATTSALSIPTVELTLGEVSKTKIEFSVSETDADEVGAITKIELLQGETVKATAANTDVRFFDGLLTNNTYTVRLTYKYDLNDGAGIKQIVKTVGARTGVNNLPSIDITLGTVGETKIEFSITETDTSNVGAIAKIELLQGEVVKATATNTDVRFFDGLFTNNEYTVCLTYTYDLGDGTGMQTIVKKVSATTLARTKPTISLTQETVAETRIDFSITETDADEVGAISKIELMQGDTVKATAENADVRFFDGLFTNNDYTVCLTYTYDLGDGAGVQTIVKTLNVKTKALTTPTLNPSTTTVLPTEFRFEIGENDPSNVGQLTKIEFWHEGDEPSEVALTTRSFTDLLTNNNYSVRLTYKYDLNDGAGVQTIVKTLNVKTKALAIPTVSLSDTTTITDDGVSFTLQETDKDSVGAIRKVEMLQNGSIIHTVSGDVRAVTGMSEGGVYTMKITYVYDLNDGEEPYTLVLEEEVFAALPESQGAIIKSNQLIGVNASALSGASLVIPNGVTSIAKGGLNSCMELETLVLPDTLTAIESGALANCQKIVNLTIPFVGASALNDPYENERTSFFGYIFGASSFSDHNNYVPDSLKNVIITGGTSIGNAAFSYCSGLTSVTIERGITTIGNFAFSGCSSLTSVIIKEGVTEIGSGAFSECTNLTSVTLPEGITGIYLETFSYCSNLTNLNIPDSVTNINPEAFWGCEKLIEKEGGISYVDRWVIDCDEEVTSVALRSNTVGIAWRAFKDCSKLRSITIPESVTSIGMMAFAEYGGDVTFENTEGWTAGTTVISSTDLANSRTAVTYLKSTYAEYTWTRS